MNEEMTTSEHMIMDTQIAARVMGFSIVVSNVVIGPHQVYPGTIADVVISEDHISSSLSPYSSDMMMALKVEKKIWEMNHEKHNQYLNAIFEELGFRTTKTKGVENRHVDVPLLLQRSPENICRAALKVIK